MRSKWAVALPLILGLVISSILASLASAQDVSRMTKEELKVILGSPDVTVIDVRLGGDRDHSSLKIKGAVREDPRDVSSWMDKYPKDKTLVFYCA